MRELVSPLRSENSADAIAATLSNPGQLYNIGNGLAFCGALVLFIWVSITGHSVTTDGFIAHFLGNWPALLTTTASVIFWISGMNYAKAWAHGFPPDAKANTYGHALSTLGAVIIGIALMGLARTEVSLALAIIATILHAGGKLASWQTPNADDYFKPMPLYSRVPYVTTLCLDMRSDFLMSTTWDGLLNSVVLPFFLLIATMFWAKADWLLLQKEKN